jgi:ribonuclease BN (tRNA processing enzyme)
MMRLITLGTAGWIPTVHRETTCLAVSDDGGGLVVFDAGTGLGRLASPTGQALLDGVESVHLVLTHYHLDHVCGLAYLPAVLQGRALVVHAPPSSVNGTDPERALSELIRPPYNPGGWDAWEGIEVRELGAGDNEVAGHRLRLRGQEHPGTSVGYRLDDAFALATDTPPDEGTEELARGVTLLAHDCWYNDDDPSTRTLHPSLLPSFSSHSEVSAVASLADRAGVRRLLLMHLNPVYDEAYYERMLETARRRFDGALLLPDETTVELSDAD